MKRSLFVAEIRKKFGRDHKPSARTKQFLASLVSQVDSLAENEAEDLFVIFSAFEAARRQQREGKHLRVKKYPAATSEVRHPSWVDHGFRTKSLGGNDQFHSDPYCLPDKALKELVALIDAGWSVSVDARESSYYPGVTLRVTVAKSDQDVASR